MLGGLARWLRVAGYDATWHPHINDWDLIRLAQREGRVLLSSDGGIFRVGIVRDGEVSSLFLPPGLSRQEQLAHVLNQLQLPIREPRCMSCGGALVEVPKEQVRERVPPRSFAWQEHYYECTRCGRLFWQGTHWHQIQAALQQVASTSNQPGESQGDV